MASFNKTILIGNLTADPEIRNFPSGGKVAKGRFAVNNRRKNAQSGEWEDNPMYLDLEIYNRGEYGKLADVAEQRTQKGTQLFVEGRLELDTWEAKDGGGMRSKHKLVVDTLQVLARGRDAGDETADSAPTAPAAKKGRGGKKATVPVADDGGEEDNGQIPF